ncbi:AAA family ATPase [Hamadaea sp. NPDC050747]|uniref:AAA family ATPase n=1 Tax=Hamadaea sp. NPDC050747 TaxID=3155789 RepID=UPI0033C652DB
MSDTVVDLVQASLNDSALTTAARRYALAAVMGTDALAQAISTPDRPIETDNSADTAEQTARQFWLCSVTVAGFRGVGARQTLTLAPGPGLTLVTGRNGSGKSSFAEAIEVALTGQHARLKESPADWRKQWRNIHNSTPPEVTVDLLVDGDERPLTIRRQWTGKAIEQAESTVEWAGVPAGGLEQLRWDEAMTRFRPFLSYDDLGKVSGKPSTPFDLMLNVIGLTSITSALTALTKARDTVAEKATVPSETINRLREELEAADDSRAKSALKLLQAERLDTVALAHLLAEPVGTVDHSTSSVLGRLATLPLPDEQAVNAAAQRLHRAQGTLNKVKGTDTEQAMQLVSLLEAALDHYDRHGMGSCPVCGTGGLDDHWRARTDEQVASLRKQAETAVNARREMQDALAAAHRLVTPPPVDLAAVANGAIPTAALRGAWEQWATLAKETEAQRLSDAMLEGLPTLLRAAQTVKDAATAQLLTRENIWRPVAARIQTILDLYSTAEQHRPMHEALCAATDWMKAESERLREIRLAPFRDQSARMWAELRHESNADLGSIAFVGSGATRRKLDVTVTIDGEAGAVSMLSNGEIHALGLALFLPRSTAPESPFRFIVIDDPVQAMDPAKVDGLARVLHATAETRQVVVFTHDDRLSNALRRLGLAASVLEVARREGSVVEIIPNLDPIARHLDDARRIARSDRLPADFAALTIAGSCRDAIEIACQRVARQRMHLQGLGIAEVDDLLIRAQTTKNRVALALLGESRMAGQLMTHLSRTIGAPWAADVLRAVREGTHHPRDQAGQIIEDSQRLCNLILQELDK